MLHRCAHRVFYTTGYGKYESGECGKRARFLRGDSWFCGIHDPAAVQERKSALDEKESLRQLHQEGMQELIMQIERLNANIEAYIKEKEQ